VGALGALVVANTVKNIPAIRKQLDKMDSKPMAAAIPSAVTLGVGVLIHQYAKGQFKNIAKWIVAASTFKLIDDATDVYFREEFPKMFGDEGKEEADAEEKSDKVKDETKKDLKKTGTTDKGDTPGYYGGAYMPVDTDFAAMSGAYLDLDTGGVSSHSTFGIH
jgi:hypothetical protein